MDACHHADRPDIEEVEGGVCLPAASKTTCARLEAKNKRRKNEVCL